jgi:hypothetical protein
LFHAPKTSSSLFYWTRGGTPLNGCKHVPWNGIVSPKRRTYKSSQCDWWSNMLGLRRVLPRTETNNHSDQLQQGLFPYTLIIARRGPHSLLFHRNVCRSRSFQLYFHRLQFHKHTHAHHLYRSQPIQDRTTTTKPKSQPLVPEHSVILTKW